MDAAAIRKLLEDVRTGRVGPDEALEHLRRLPFEEVAGMARVDHHRSLRSGVPEVVFGEGKSAEQIALILESLAGAGEGALATRVDADKGRALADRLGRGAYHADARVYLIEPERPRSAGRPPVAVVSAGTSDRAVAEEAALTLEFLGHSVARFADVGVAGMQRLLAVVEDLRECEVAVVVAGMEGALPTVVSSLIAAPVIAVPTSVGYGVGVGGYVAMMGMLATCAPGISVVNIDNGFGAAVAAARIQRISQDDE